MIINQDNPFQAFEDALAAYAQSRISHEDFLQFVEGQYRLVQTWIRDLQAVREQRFASLIKHQGRCMSAYQAFAQGLKEAHQAISQRNRGGLDQARATLRWGHEHLSFTQVA